MHNSSISFRAEDGNYNDIRKARVKKKMTRWMKGEGSDHWIDETSITLGRIEIRDRTTLSLNIRDEIEGGERSVNHRYCFLHENRWILDLE